MLDRLTQSQTFRGLWTVVLDVPDVNSKSCEAQGLQDQASAPGGRDAS